MDNARVLPPETIQKEFERNPLKLLEELRLEENSDQNFEDEKNQTEIDRKPMKNPQENEDINITNLNCKNSLINVNCNPYNNSNENNNFNATNFNKSFDLNGKTESKSNENDFVNTSVNNSHYEKNILYFQENSNFDKPCIDNIKIKNSLLENSLDESYSKNVNNCKPINIYKF